MKHKKGFTLIELLVVMAVIAVMASIAFVSLGNARDKAREAKVKSEQAQIQRLLDMEVILSGDIQQSLIAIETDLDNVTETNYVGDDTYCYQCLINNTDYCSNSGAPLVEGTCSALGVCEESTEQHTLTIYITGEGTTTPGEGERSYDSGDSVTVTHSASSGWEFSEWQDDCLESGSCSLTMDSDKTVTAVFTEIPFSEPEVTTNEASSIGQYEATLNGNLTSLGSAASVDVYFEYRQGSDPWTSTTPQLKETTETFSQYISGLDADTDYEFKAIVEYEDGTTQTVEGSALTFETAPGCFSGDTMVYMADGSQKMIQDMEIGDMVLSYNKETGETTEGEVGYVFYNDPGAVKSYLEISTSEGKKIKVTRTHRLYGEEGLKEADQYSVGDKLLSGQGRYVTITEIENIPENIMTFNLFVPESNTFVVEGVVVGNMRLGRIMVGQLPPPLPPPPVSPV
jgi:prepilin-type N-terminal cleavage/methylation domain-containing protein